MARIKIKNMSASDPTLHFTLAFGADTSLPQDATNPTIPLVVGDFSVIIHVYDLNTNENRRDVDFSNAIKIAQLDPTVHKYDGTSDVVCNVEYPDDHYFEGIDLMATIEISQVSNGVTNSVIVAYPSVFRGGA